MRYSLRPLLLLAAAGLTAAKPYPRDSLHDAGFSYLMPRECDSYCGADNQYCCESGEVCTTLDQVATCIADGSYVGAVVTTWTETRTYTSTIMTLWDSAPEATAGVDCIPQNSVQEACGTICCAGWQTCASTGQCSPKSGMEGGTTIVVTSNGKVTTQYSAPYRVTGTTVITTEGVVSGSTASETGSATSSSTTATSDSDVIGAGSDNGTGGGLSAGAIAGIVIGTLAGVALLILLCFCCIVRGLWVAIFGKKKEKDSSERVDVYEEHYSRHGSRPATVHSRRPAHKRWFGGGGAPSSAGSRREKKDSGKKWLGIAGLAATLLALLNLKKDKKPSSKPSRSSRGSSRHSDSYYSYSDYTGSGSSSSGGRTHRTRRTRDSRGSRATRAQSYYTNSERRA